MHSFFSSPSGKMLRCIHEHSGEDIAGIYVSNSSTNGTVLCLEELVLPSSELIPHNEVAPVADAEIWQQFDISDNYACKETIMWNRLSNYVEQGNVYISAIHDNKRFRGWDGRPDGCNLKPTTLAALNARKSIPDDQVKQIELDHDLFFSPGGIMCVDKESPLHFSA